MSLRKFSVKTQISYIRAINRLCEYLQHLPENATREELREFQLFLVNDGATGTTIGLGWRVLLGLFLVADDKQT
jgi:integrase/recombinase XerD